jgi:queuine tRNA-ribosyltransferase
VARDLQFRLHSSDPCGARRAGFRTAHGVVDTPAFMPVGTQGAVKAVLPRDVADTGAQVVLANTYHLSLEDRTDLVERAGGLHAFMAWERAILTDSGGFQVFSLPGREVSDDGVTFPGEKGGPRLLLDPEGSLDIQRRLGADIVMAFDECCAHDAPRRYVEASVERTARWARRCRAAPLAPHQFLFGIVQGGVHEALRRRSAAQVRELDFDGTAIGGVSVGEGHELMAQVVRWTAPLLPEDRPRYLMGVGLPEDILAAVELGMDLFDCVIPTRYARGGTLFTRKGPIRIGDKAHRHDKGPLDPRCRCLCCRQYSRLVLRHLHYAHEPLFETLASVHNLHFYQDLMADARHEIERGRFADWKRAWLRRYLGSDPRAPAEAGGHALRPEDP